MRGLAAFLPLAAAVSLSGCWWVVAGGAGAEAGYVGVVTLKGVVDSEAERKRALDLARGISGVKDVVDKMFVSR